ncbi:hypothetical protein GCM10022243_18220 [Saccharothrix violaceirubra]|uniref:Uncharacterized protein n=1 Tax=Saccharothrix violaceirubra TaxID=413306 RepID=A0A7W7WVF6_9PSEU|nr:hypothetical protein [Saccharothrix violaceirubra]MBB4965270.1 hypothetical protein [Saccharothrix violaceirubra]
MERSSKHLVSRVLVAVAAAALLGGLGVVFMPTRDRVPAFDIGSGTAPECPVDALPRPEPSPDGIVRTTLCAFAPTADGTGRYSRALVLESDGEEIVEELTDLPDRPLPDQGCFAVLRPHYRLVVHYADGAERAVDVDLACATATSADRTRYGDVPAVLDAFAEEYRDQGGDLPPPPWLW